MQLASLTSLLDGYIVGVYYVSRASQSMSIQKGCNGWFEAKQVLSEGERWTAASGRHTDLAQLWALGAALGTWRSFGHLAQLWALGATWGAWQQLTCMGFCG